MNAYERFIRERITFNVPGITERKKNIYIFMLKELMHQYDKMNPKFMSEFEGLRKIIVTTNQKDIPCPNAVGCCTFSEVSSMYWDDINYDSIIMSMELAHFAVNKYFNDTKISNDLVHYAANVGTEPYVYWTKYRYLTKADWLMKRPAIYVPTFVYNMPYLMKEKDRIMREVINGSAPKGVNPYWSGASARGMPQPIIDYIQHYQSHAHGHDHKH